MCTKEFFKRIRHTLKLDILIYMILTNFWQNYMKHHCQIRRAAVRWHLENAQTSYKQKFSPSISKVFLLIQTLSIPQINA